MTTERTEPDPLLRLVAGLNRHEPEPSKAERLRARCHRVMMRRRRDASHPGLASGAGWQPLIEATVVVTLSVIYLFEVVRRALQLYGF